MTDLMIETTRFGGVTLPEERLLHFLSPILGFEGSLRYVLLDHGEGSPFKWMQSVDEAELAFVVTHPQWFGLDYVLELPDEAVARLELDSPEDVLVVTIVNIPAENPARMTTNLLGPIVINQRTRQAMQVVLHDSRYGTKTRLIPDESPGGEADGPPGPPNISASMGILPFMGGGGRD